MSAEDIESLISLVAANPMAGTEIPGTGGCRKIRVAGRGKGKSGGYRTITFFSGSQLPVFLIAVFSKGDRADLSQKERNALANITKLLAAEYAAKIVKVSGQR